MIYCDKYKTNLELDCPFMLTDTDTNTVVCCTEKNYNDVKKKLEENNECS